MKVTDTDDVYILYHAQIFCMESYFEKTDEV
jgi:hypothetical protein